MIEPLVSVQMITYNHEPYIAEAIEGVLQQRTNFPFELVIGEDCSTDRTREIVLEYQKKYSDIIRVLTSERNVGAIKNSDRIRKACRGKYIAFCEGDDYWHSPCKIQKQADYLERHPECGLVSTDCDIYYNGSNKFKRSFNYNNGFQSPANFSIEQVLSQEVPIWTCTVMIRRHLYEQVIESDFYLHQSGQLFLGDIQIWAEVALLSEVTYIPESLATYRILEESASRSRDPRKYLRFKKSFYDIKLYLRDKHKLSESLRKSDESAWCDISLRLAFHERNADLAMEVKKKKQVLTWEERVRYYGAKYWAIHYGCRTAAFFRNLFRKKRDGWP